MQKFPKELSQRGEIIILLALQHVFSQHESVFCFLIFVILAENPYIKLCQSINQFRHFTVKKIYFHFVLLSRILSPKVLNLNLL